MKLVALTALTLLPAAILGAQSAPQLIGPNPRGGTALAVRVPDGPLVFTGLIHATGGREDARAQAGRALQALGAALASAGSDVSRVVRLNAYVTSDTAVAGVEAAVAAQFGDTPVAFTLVRSPLPVANALVAFDAVAMSARAPAAVEVVNASVAILPVGGKIFISGQAEKGTDLASAVKLTMAGLHRTLAHFRLQKSDVVHVKAFIKPFSDHATATREIAASFNGGPVPPIVLMEWVSELYAEIELVAAARGLEAPARETIAHLSLPWMTTSPRYCRVAQVPAGTPLIFIGGIAHGEPSASTRHQMQGIFATLGTILFDAGSSFRHLAKATYYLVDPAARAVLGDIRDVYYDPARPPAASALELTGLGHPGRAAMIDLIAVPAK